jgi:aspartate-semialdehyde dehydrogenase
MQLKNLFFVVAIAIFGSIYLFPILQNNNKMKVAVVGVTGMVGQVMCRVLEERNFPITDFLPVASDRSVGKEVIFKGKQHKIISITEAIKQAPNLALFSAGGSISKEFAPLFAAAGTTVIDNSSAFRMDEDKPLIVPEVNIHCLKQTDKIIANPNCSTIQLVVALKPLHQAYGIDRLVISTYQSMTGTGVQAVKQYEEEMQKGEASNPAYPHPIFQNCIPHCDVFFDNGYTREELKLVWETRKILEDNSLRITATAVRVPIQGGHSESVNVSFNKDFEVSELRAILEKADGVIVVDNPSKNQYPMPLNAHHKDEVFVGRIRRDESAEKTVNLWVVSDNLRKGAATNTVQIAEYLEKKGWLNS